jgi:S1-C subfamily serine protease
MSLFSSFILLASCCAGPSNVVSPISSVHVPISAEKRQQRAQQIESVKKIKSLTVALTDLSPGKNMALCSAVWIKQGLLLTANHCVKDSILLSYMTIEDFVLDNPVARLAVVRAQDEDNDLALLSVDPSTETMHDIASLSEDSIESGDEVNIIGHTMGFEWTYSKGYVAAIRNNVRSPGFTNVEKVIQISSPAWMGNSGGGAFSPEGELVGICSWVSTAGPFLTFFIHANSIHKFLVKEHVI